MLHDLRLAIRVVRLVLSRVTILVAIGVVVGAGVSVWLSRFVATLLYGLEPRDPVTLGGAAVTLAARCAGRTAVGLQGVADRPGSVTAGFLRLQIADRRLAIEGPDQCERERQDDA